MPRAPEVVHRRILETADRLFYQHGTSNVGVDRIIAEAEVAKATLFRHFPTKEHLITAYLEARNERSLARMQAAIASCTGTRHPVLVLFDNLAARSRSRDFLGCAFLLAVSQQSQSASVRNVAKQHKASVRALFRRLLAEEFDDPDVLALQLSFIYDGALANIIVNGPGDEIVHAAELAEALLNMRLLKQSA